MVASIVMAVLGRGAWREVERHRAPLRWLAATPHATLAAPVPGPAIYAGVLQGPNDRTTPLGTRASAYWWWVEERHGRSSKTVCTESERSELRLVDGSASAPLDAIANATDVALTTGSDGAWTSRVVVDLGSGGQSTSAGPVPSRAGRCAKSHRSYAERWIPVGTRVEVLACHDGVALRACPGGPHDAVLAIPTLALHREHRAEAALVGVRTFALGSLAAILFVFLVTLFGKGAVLRGMTPARRRA